MGAITTDAKTPILGDGKRDPTKTYMEFTRGIGEQEAKRQIRVTLGIEK